MVLLIAFATQSWIAAQRDSVTVDEYVHLPVGLYALETGDLRLDPINPPFPRMISALPVWMARTANIPTKSVPHWDLGRNFMELNAVEYHSHFVSSRRVTVAAGLILGILVFSLGVSLGGPTSGTVALAMFAFSPNILAHSHLVTLDIFAAVGFMLVTWMLWRVQHQPSVTHFSVLGAAFAIAMLTKLSAVVLLPAIGIVVWTTARTNALKVRWLWAIAAFSAAFLVTVHLAYGAKEMLRPLGNGDFHPNGLLGTISKFIPGLRSPVPLPLLEGIDLTLNESRGWEPSFFLNGELSSKGWWYYYLFSFVYKTPLAVLFALAAYIIIKLTKKQAISNAEVCLWVPMITLLIANSLFNSQQIGVRHMLPAYPLLFVALGYWLSRLGHLPLPKSWIAPAVSVAIPAWMAVESALIAPRYLQYFNAFGGGADRGHEHLIDSNLDWGQDLIRLREYLENNPQRAPIQLAYFGRVEPEIYGIDYQPLEPPGRAGTAVVSASFLMGRPYYWKKGGKDRWVLSGTYTWLQSERPVDRVGALFVFELSDQTE